jgi:hypothetical protein
MVRTSPRQHARQLQHELVLRAPLELALELPLAAPLMGTGEVGVQGLEHGESPDEDKTEVGWFLGLGGPCGIGGNGRTCRGAGENRCGGH